MTTGRINQITRIAAESPPGADAPKALPTSPPRRRTECISGRDARSARPPRQPRLTGKDANGHPIAPTKPLRTGPHADRPSPSLRQAGGLGCPAAYGPREEGPDPVVTPANGGYPRSGSLQESFVSGVASGHPSTDPISAGRHTAPGLRPPRPPRPVAVRLRTAGTAADEYPRHWNRAPRAHSLQPQKGSRSGMENCIGEFPHLYTYSPTPVGGVHTVHAQTSSKVAGRDRV